MIITNPYTDQLGMSISKEFCMDVELFYQFIDF
jgi:hypothetical protein